MHLQQTAFENSGHRIFKYWQIMHLKLYPFHSHYALWLLTN